MTDKKIEDRLIRSRVQLLVEMPFFGQLALFLKLRERKDLPTAATDGKSYFYNPDFIKGLTDTEVNFLTAHETLHPALGHLWRRGSRDPVIWNHAADYVINAMIKECDPNEKNFKLIKNVLYDKKYDGMSSEEVYEILINDPNYVQKAKQQAMMNGGGAGQPGGTLDDHSQWGKASADGGDGDEEGQGGEGSQDSGGEEDWKARVVAAAEVASGRDKGKVPSLIKRMIGELTQPQKNWKDLLAEFISQEINDYGFNPPDRRFSWNDIILPDFSEPEDVIKWLVFVIDTSGSITEKQFIAFISEVVGCLAQFGGKVKGKLIYCDADIHNEGIYELEDAAHSLPRGGGGTDFRPPFEWVEENMEDCSGLVYLTDTYGTFPDKEPHYPVLWACIIKDAKVPFGNTTYLDVPSH